MPPQEPTVRYGALTVVAPAQRSSRRRRTTAALVVVTVASALSLAAILASDATTARTGGGGLSNGGWGVRSVVNSELDSAIRRMPGDDLQQQPDCRCEGDCDNDASDDGLHYCDVASKDCMGIDYKAPRSGVLFPTLDSCVDAAGEVTGNCRAACQFVQGRYDCWSFPCVNGGFCIDGVDDYECHCTVGFKGDQCQVDIDECIFEGDERRCADNSICRNSKGRFECECLRGFEGDGYQPENATGTGDDRRKGHPSPPWLVGDRAIDGWVQGCVDKDDCMSTPCEHDGECSDAGPDAFECDCTEGWIGDTCSVDVNECGENGDNCDPNAVCRNIEGGFTCTCLPGFVGGGHTNDFVKAGLIAAEHEGCEDIDDCASSPCHNGATCVDEGNGNEDFVCVCGPGWRDGTCSTDIDECAKELHNCHEEALCTNTGGSFTCMCNSGYTGDGVASCIDADDCEFSPCGNGGSCVDCGTNCYACDCAPGWRGRTCLSDWNECTMGIHSCHDDATCVNTAGSFTCVCDPGYTGDGYIECNDIDDCTGVEGTAGAACGAYGQCTDYAEHAGRYTCDCSAGWQDQRCQTDINECYVDKKNPPCHRHAKCDNVDGSFTCTCNEGYAGDGLDSCADVDDCVGQPCGVHGKCIDIGPTAFRCECTEGWTDARCDYDMHECQEGTHDCEARASCTNVIGSYVCACNAGYSGDGITFCADVDDCALDPCMHGTCRDVGENAFRCDCDGGWTDTHCDYDVNECFEGTHDCHEEARCVNTPGGYYCRCMSGYEGDGYNLDHVHTKESAVDMFIQRRCLDANHKRSPCVYEQYSPADKAAGKKKKLVPGLTFDGFFLNKLHAKRTHVDASEFVGTLAIGCIDLDDCDPARDGMNEEDDPCSFEHATCEDGGANEYLCRCDEGWTGDTCSMDVNECMTSAHACAEDAKCFNTVGSYECACDQNYYGDGRDCDACRQCTPGWTEGKRCNMNGRDRTCVDEDECEIGIDTCDSHALCFNTEGSFTCVCDLANEWWGTGTTCSRCTTCGPGYHVDLDKETGERLECTATRDRECRLNLKDGLYTISSEADSTVRCMIMGVGYDSVFPERHNWGFGDYYCGMQADPDGGHTAREQLLHNRQAVWRLTHLKSDLYTIESNADGKGWRCLRFGRKGDAPYPDLHTWSSPSQDMCGFAADQGATAETQLLMDGTAVWRLQPLGNHQYLVQSAAGNRGWECLAFESKGESTNPSRFHWGQGDDYCGAGSKEDLSLKEAADANKRAVFVLSSLSLHASEFV